MRTPHWLLSILFSKPLNYPSIKAAISWDPEYQDRPSTHKDSSVRSTLCRLKKEGLITRSSQTGEYRITEKGKKQLNRWNTQRKTEVERAKYRKGQTNTKTSDERVVFIYDVPHDKSWARRWLRQELAALNYTRIQKSVWLGPPLPEYLWNEIHARRLEKFIHIFSIKKSGTLKMYE